MNANHQTFDPWSWSPQKFRFIPLSLLDILSLFKNLDAGWAYEGEPDPSKLHAELTSGKCSNGYFDCRRVLRYPNLNEILAWQLFKELQGVVRPEGVVGSAYSAITWSYEVARAFGVPHFFVEKDPKDEKQKRMIFKEELPNPDMVLLQAEELITTLGTTQEVRRAVLEKWPSARFLSEVGVCIHRPDKVLADTEDRQVIALVDTIVKNWDPQDCPYCKAGSLRVKPKANWAQLVGRA